MKHLIPAATPQASDTAGILCGFGDDSVPSHHTFVLPLADAGVSVREIQR